MQAPLSLGHSQAFKLSVISHFTGAACWCGHREETGRSNSKVTGRAGRAVGSWHQACFLTRERTVTARAWQECREEQTRPQTHRELGSASGTRLGRTYRKPSAAPTQTHGDTRPSPKASETHRGRRCQTAVLSSARGPVWPWLCAPASGDQPAPLLSAE